MPEEEKFNEIVASDNLRQNACICLIADGTFDGHTAATLEPYTDNSSTWGMLFYDDEALRLFTINSAKIGFEENIKGSIEKGKLADFVVLSRDPYLIPHDEIGNITVEMTILGGNIVYQNKT